MLLQSSNLVYLDGAGNPGHPVVSNQQIANLKSEANLFMRLVLLGLLSHQPLWMLSDLIPFNHSVLTRLRIVVYQCVLLFIGQLVPTVDVWQWCGPDCADLRLYRLRSAQRLALLVKRQSRLGP